MTDRPKVFLGSTREALPIANAINADLGREADVTVWVDAFPPGSVTIEALERATREHDFAIFVLAADDTLKSRDETNFVPRDNVIFELGLFIAALGRERTFFVVNQEVNTKLPTDLSGVKFVTYHAPAGSDPMQALRATCFEIQQAIVRAQPWDSPRRFAKSISGHWWQPVYAKSGHTALSLVQIESRSDSVSITGRGYAANGSWSAEWNSRAVCLDGRDARIVYFWEGDHPDEEAAVRVGGFGEFSFERPAGGSIDSARGYFLDMPLESQAPTLMVRKTVSLRRAIADDVKTMKDGTARDKVDLIARILEQLRP